MIQVSTALLTILVGAARPTPDQTTPAAGAEAAPDLLDALRSTEGRWTGVARVRGRRLREAGAAPRGRDDRACAG